MSGLKNKNNTSPGTMNIDVYKAIENPDLKRIISRFKDERTEANAMEFGKRLNRATFLSPMAMDEMKMSLKDDGTTIVEVGSKIKLLNCFNEHGECFFPLFTDWDAIRAWTNQNVGGLIMPAIEAWEYVIEQPDYYKGIVINPNSDGWTLRQENIRNLIEDYRRGTI
jgi:hypothetical protein